jgi:chromosome segregation ATPase
MDTPTLVPVTEAEMATWTQRLMTTVVSYSKQSAELDEIKQRVNSLYDQVSQLREENATLKRDRDDALALAVENENKLNDARRHRDSLEHTVSSLNETITSRDSKVRELEGLLTSARLESTDWQRKCEHLDRVNADLTNTLATVRERRDHWHNRAEDAERELAETKAKLQKVVEQMSTMSDILGIVKQQAKEVPAEASPTPAPSTESIGVASTGGIGSTTSSEPAKPWWEQPATESQRDPSPF